MNQSYEQVFFYTLKDLDTNKSKILYLLLIHAIFIYLRII